MARYLDNYDIPVKVLLFVEKSKIAGDALVHFKILQKTDIEIVEIYSDEKVDIQKCGRIAGHTMDNRWFVWNRIERRT